MSEFTPSAPVRRGSPHASLVALGLKLRPLDLLAPLREHLEVNQKTVRHTPIEKLTDVFIGLLAGVHGIAAINTVLRTDPALQAAFGRRACAEQSTLQDTLDACTAANVVQMEAACDQIYRQHSRGYRHDDAQDWQILDVDLSGLPCGPKAAFATPGYFAGGKARRGRQLGRVLASRYDEVVVDRLFAGKTVLATALLPLLDAAEQTLELDPARRARTLIRVDAGGGSVGDLNALLERGYAVLAKDYSRPRAARLAATVTDWYSDPKVPGRQVGWVGEPATDYVRAVVRIAVRCPRRNGQWAVGVLIATLSPAAVLARTPQPESAAAEAAAVLRAYAWCYDQRGGGVETAFKGDKQGLGLAKRNKKRFAAQQLVMLLGALAHNVLVWARAWLAPAVPAVRRYGIQRLVRDLWGIGGTVELDPSGPVVRIILNQANRLAHHCLAALQALVGTENLVIILGET
jgi:hypothetical protein